VKGGRRVRKIGMEGIDRHNVYYKEEIKFPRKCLFVRLVKVAWSQFKMLGK
jgi:hypothetical protein